MDGRFFNHDPSLAAIGLALQAGYALEDIVLAGTDITQWGSYQWQNDTNQDTPPLLIGGTQSPILSMSLNGASSNTTAMVAGIVLEQSFFNINPTITVVPEDDISKIDYLKKVATSMDLTNAVAFIQSQWIPD